MARPFPTSSLQSSGDVEFEQISPEKYRVLFTPPADAVLIPGMERLDFKRPIMVVDNSSKVCTIFPYTVHGVRPMSAKYYGIGVIEVDVIRNAELNVDTEDGLETFLYKILPNAFAEDFNYGLGFKKNYKPIISLIESFDIDHLRITTSGKTEIDTETKRASIKRVDLDKMCDAIDRISRKAQKVSMSLKKNAVNELFFDLITNEADRHNTKKETEELAKRIGMTSRFMTGGATRKEQDDAIKVLKKNGKKIITERPEELIKLKNEIELVSLEGLIDRFETMLKNDLKESQWQKLFNENPFILNMALGIPVLKIQEQASMGGMTFSGGGTKIADFLVKNRLSNNTVIVEIKTPGIKLLSAKPYRSGIYAPSSDLNAAVSQVLDQLNLFQLHINDLKIASREYDLEAYAVHGVLIAGVSLKEPDAQKSFELLRGNSKNVQIITFDELLQKLKDLFIFLRPEEVVRKENANVDNISRTDLPF